MKNKYKYRSAPKAPTIEEMVEDIKRMNWDKGLDNGIALPKYSASDTQTWPDVAIIAQKYGKGAILCDNYVTEQNILVT